MADGEGGGVLTLGEILAAKAASRSEGGAGAAAISVASSSPKDAEVVVATEPLEEAAGKGTKREASAHISAPSSENDAPATAAPVLAPAPSPAPAPAPVEVGAAAVATGAVPTEDLGPLRKRSKWHDSDDEEDVEDAEVADRDSAGGGATSLNASRGGTPAMSVETSSAAEPQQGTPTGVVGGRDSPTQLVASTAHSQLLARTASSARNSPVSLPGSPSAMAAAATAAAAAAIAATEAGGASAGVATPEGGVVEEEGGGASTPESESMVEMYFPALSGCRSIKEFKQLNKIEEGTYGEVFRVEDVHTHEIMAVKRFKLKTEDSGFPITALREINTLLKCKHENIVAVREILVGSTPDQIFVAMEFVEHDMKSLLETMSQPFLAREVKCLMDQLLKGVDHLHQLWILHRDLKTSNLLMSHRGVLKIADFGLAREYGSPLKNYTPLVVTLWYRSPELLLGTKTYSTEVDNWSVGCIFAELLTQKALFPAKTELECLNKIFQLLGTPNERVWEGYNELPHVKKWTFKEFPKSHWRQDFAFLTTAGFELLTELLRYDPAKRISARGALDHEWFVEHPKQVTPEEFPHWPAKSEGEKQKKRKVEEPAAPGGRIEAADDDVYVMEEESRGATYTGPAGFSLRF
jgi:serine/threonine protein kinase